MKSLVLEPKKPAGRLEFFIVYLGLYSSGFAITVILPIAGEMVMNFGMTSDKDKTGYYVGLFTTAMMFGRTISSPLWGYLMDSWGRRPVTLLSLLFISILSIAFGVSSSMAWAVAVRFLLGLLVPIVISSKTLISELCNGNDVSSSMAWINVTFNVGSISGNFFGGIFSDPIGKGYKFPKLFSDNPYLLPNMLPAVISIVVLILAYIYLRETLVKEDTSSNISKSRGMKEILTEPEVLPIIIIYVLACFNYQSFLTILTQYAWAKPKSGGLGLNTTDIGLLLAISSISILLFQQLIYLFFVKRSGNISILRYSLILQPAITIIIPITSILGNQNAKLIVLVILCAVWYLIDFLLSTAIIVLLNNSVHPSELGRVNGAVMSLICIARVIAPTVSGWTFALILNSSLSQPFNYSGAFILLGSTQLISFLFTYKLDKKSESSYEKRSSEIPLVNFSASS